MRDVAHVSSSPTPHMQRLLLVFAGVFTLGTEPSAIRAQEFALVVNSANPVTSISKDEVAKLFLKKQVTWQSGDPAAPVELPPSAKVREAFVQTVLGKSLSQVRSYWQQQIFSGRDVPPPEKPSEDDVLAFVRANPGAIGYVTRGASLGRGVKVVTLVP
jgi:ABC-type phosphate transport system substrate-binding protein